MRLGPLGTGRPQELFDAGKIHDTLASGNGYGRVVRTLTFPEEVVVEGEFIDDRIATQDNVDASTVNRIQIRLRPCHRTGTSGRQYLWGVEKDLADSTLYVDASQNSTLCGPGTGASFLQLIEQSPALSTRTDGSLTPEMIPTK